MSTTSVDRNNIRRMQGFPENSPLFQQQKSRNPMPSTSLVAFQISSKFRGSVGIAGAPCFMVDYLALESVVCINVGDKPIKGAKLNFGVIPCSSHMDNLHDKTRQRIGRRNPDAQLAFSISRRLRCAWNLDDICAGRTRPTTALRALLSNSHFWIIITQWQKNTKPELEAASER